MPKILVYDCAAETGGALTVLESFYKKFLLDCNNDYYFVLSVVDLEEKGHVHVEKLPWVKKSWFHRLFCDLFYIKKLIKQIEPDSILSLQNIGIPFCKIKQVLYVHNVIPFTDYKFSLLREPFLWFYQNVIGLLMIHSIKRADKIIVQTNWMKREIQKKARITQERIQVEPVQSNIEYDIREKPAEITESLFFYPASSMSFKNHIVIVNACKILKGKGISDYKVVFTFDSNENDRAKKLSDIVSANALPIEFVGVLDQKQMCDYYEKSVLLFPSILESVGLPLIEAQGFSASIIAADCAYAHEAIGNYQKCHFFDPDDSNALCDLMEKTIMNV